MLFWWCAAGVLLAVAYMVTYTLLRTSGDNRRWFARLRRPNGLRGQAGDSGVGTKTMDADRR